MKYKIFCDLDGVLCDFEKGAKDALKKKNNNNNNNISLDDINPGKLWSTIRSVDKFYETLPWMKGGKLLWETLVQHCYNNKEQQELPTILTGVPIHKSSRDEKANWCLRELSNVTIHNNNNTSDNNNNATIQVQQKLLQLQTNHVDMAGKKNVHTIVKGEKKSKIQKNSNNNGTDNNNNNLVVDVITCWSKNKHMESFYDKKACHRSVLIDDRIELKEKWEKRGGIFIHHINTKNTIKLLKEKGILSSPSSAANNINNNNNNNNSWKNETTTSKTSTSTTTANALTTAHNNSKKKKKDNNNNNNNNNQNSSSTNTATTASSSSRRRRHCDCHRDGVVCLVPLRRGKRLFVQCNSIKSDKNNNKIKKHEKKKRPFIELWRDDAIIGDSSCSGSSNKQKEQFVIFGRKRIVETMRIACGCIVGDCCKDCLAVESWAMTKLSKRMVRISSKVQKQKSTTQPPQQQQQQQHHEWNVSYRGMNSHLLFRINKQSMPPPPPANSNNANDYDYDNWTDSCIPLTIGSILTFGSEHQTSDAIIEYEVVAVRREDRSNDEDDEREATKGISCRSTVEGKKQDNAATIPKKANQNINSSVIDLVSPRINSSLPLPNYTLMNETNDSNTASSEVIVVDDGKNDERGDISENHSSPQKDTVVHVDDVRWGEGMSPPKLYTQQQQVHHDNNKQAESKVQFSQSSSLPSSSLPQQQQHSEESTSPKPQQQSLQEQDDVIVIDHSTKDLPKMNDDVEVISISSMSPKKVVQQQKQFTLFFLPLGQSMPPSRIQILTQSARKKGAMVVESLDGPPKPTHLVLQDNLDSAAVANALGFSNAEELASNLSERNIDAVTPDWLNFAGDKLQDPLMRQIWRGLPRFATKKRPLQTKDDNPISTKKQRTPAETTNAMMEEVESDLEDSQQLSQPYMSASLKQRHRNAALSEVFSKLAKLHQDCPLQQMDEWRAYTFSLISGRLKHLEFEIIDDEQVLKKVQATKGFGASTMSKIKEFLRKGSLQRIKEFETNPERVAMNDIMHIWGVGKMKAREMINQGYRTIEQVREAVASGRLYFTKNQIIGLDCWEDFKEKMTREECEIIGEIVVNAFRETYDQGNITIMGSYRRGKSTCGDVDFLITHPSFVATTPRGALSVLVERLRKRGHISHHLTTLYGMTTSEDTTDGSQDIETDSFAKRTGYRTAQSYMGVFISPVVKGKRRRVDIKIYPYRERVFASIYFTGNGWFNRSLRLYSKRIKNLHLNDHGLFPDDGLEHHVPAPDDKLLLEATSEKEVFDFLGIEWFEPHERDCFDAVIPKDEKTRREFARLEVKQSELNSGEGKWVN